MEPFHQLSIPNSAVPKLESAIQSLGVSTEVHSNPILVHKHDGFSTLVCDRDGLRFVGDIGPSPDDPSVTLLVYANTSDHGLQSEIRLHLESLGAMWGYH
ncbi:hypothetical protein K227x_55470 [Rubripirellula lacrimiformis]|uniref:Uncharacterized protein n=1 Tax=Rubripirellula lacrimiformis TaxID=1930273 RepID=A0A517NJ15_9BACT|nr:hypothetical protein [Rubripirellula lacrimiformis]QDT07122.1 hypothetical protein K227x_55470 [Rubripirellula lacrimiformis]